MLCADSYMHTHMYVCVHARVYMYVCHIMYIVYHVMYVVCHVMYIVCHVMYIVCHMMYIVCHDVFFISVAAMVKESGFEWLDCHMSAMTALRQVRWLHCVVLVWSLWLLP